MSPLPLLLLSVLVVAAVFGSGEAHLEDRGGVVEFGGMTPPPCSLNGVLSDGGSGSCICDKQWTGPECERLKLSPAEANAGLQSPGNFSSWGGSVLQDGNTGIYHMVSDALPPWYRSQYGV